MTEFGLDHVDDALADFSKVIELGTRRIMPFDFERQYLLLASSDRAIGVLFTGDPNWNPTHPVATQAVVTLSLGMATMIWCQKILNTPFA